MKRITLCALSLIVVCSPAFAKEPQSNATTKQSNAVHTSGVVSAHPLATQAGLNILEQGGNAFDAAIATSAALGVVEPYGSGIGGGGFWLLYHAKADKYTVIDAREVAPLNAHKDMYLNEHGEPMKDASRNGPLAAAIPGNPAAFEIISKNFGTMPLKQSLQPAINLAQNGFQVGERYIAGVTYKKDILNPAAASIFLDNNEIPDNGWMLKQADLANTLKTIADQGAKGFYEGVIAHQMIGAVQQNGGIWIAEDLKQYETTERTPVIAEYEGAKIIMPPLPSSGGLVIKNTLNILKQYNLEQLNAADKKHIIIEAMRHAYHQRARYMGDSDFVDVPIENISSIEKAKAQSSLIKIDQATPSETLPVPTLDKAPKGTETTHFAVIDSQGNRVAVTQSINFWFGSGFVPAETGVILNNEMDDFIIKPGVKNGYGLIGTSANAIEPKKRMLSSMTPTIVETDDGILIIGTPGGSRIISMNLLGILAHLDGKTPQEIIEMPRYHHQYIPDEITYEKGAFTQEEIEALQKKGHILKQSKNGYGNMQVIYMDKKTGKITTASDPRGQGAGRVY